MPTFIAMLRGINVGGNWVKMEKLRGACEDDGFRNVKTYIQSGNIVLDTPKSPAATAKAIGAILETKFAITTPVLLRTPADLARILKRNPLAKIPNLEPSKLIVHFLSGAPAKGVAAELKKRGDGSESIVLAGEELYIYFPKGISKSPIFKVNVEKLLGVRLTARNINTVEKILELAQGDQE